MYKSRSQAYAAIKLYIKSCWVDNIKESDPCKRSKLIAKCLDGGKKLAESWKVKANINYAPVYPSLENCGIHSASDNITEISAEEFHSQMKFYEATASSCSTEDQHEMVDIEVQTFYEKVAKIRPKLAGKVTPPKSKAFKVLTDKNLTPECIQNGYAALRSYIRYCWKKNKTISDQELLTKKITDCLKEGVKIQAAYSKNCGGYDFHYTPSYPVSKPHKKSSKPAYNVATITLKEFYEAEQNYVQKIVTSETVVEYEEYTEYYYEFVEEVTTAHKDYNITKTTIPSFKEIQVSKKNARSEFKTFKSSVRSRSDVKALQSKILSKIIKCES